jgi:hypothetical protein
VVSSFVKPGANVKQIVETQEIEFKCLGRKDFIVINGGSNDLANSSTNDKSALPCLLKFAQKYPNTNVLMLNVPIRYDPLTNYRTNQDIMSVNDKLQERTKPFQHVHLIEISTDRKYFTNHGFHLNKLGKSMIVKEIVCQIKEIVNSVPKNEPTYSPHWKDDHTSVPMIIDVAQPSSSTSNEGNASQPVTKLPQERCTQHERSKLGYTSRTSNGHNAAEMSAVVETVIDNMVSDKADDEKSELESVSDLESRSGNAKETSGEPVKLELHINETRDLCIVNSEAKNVEEGKCVRVSKCMNDAKSVTVTEEGPCEIGENEQQGSDIIKANNGIRITEPAPPDTSVLSFRRSSSRNKIPPSRNSDFLW